VEVAARHSVGEVKLTKRSPQWRKGGGFWKGAKRASGVLPKVGCGKREGKPHIETWAFVEEEPCGRWRWVAERFGFANTREGKPHARKGK